MNKILTLFAIVLSGVVIVLAVDPGRFAFNYVDAGGHQFRMLIAGKRSPTVVFEAGGVGAGKGSLTVVFEAGGVGASSGPLESWERVQPAVSKFTRTVAYDRAGAGLSRPVPPPRDARQIALELHNALRNAHVPPPYVLVGHSFGGTLIRVFAGMFPNEIAGMVLVDPSQEEFIYWNESRETNHEPRKDDEWKEILASLAEAHESQVPPGVPVVLITAMGPREYPSFVTEAQKQERKANLPMWLKFHSEWLEKIPHAQHIVTENSGHFVPFEEPDLVINAIRQMVEQSTTHEGKAPIR